ncbi:hypothetical protein JCM6882_006082 [Rhodosporidiobolus microsporus]
MVSVAELRKKAEEKARYTSLPSVRQPKYEPVRPGYGQAPAFLTTEERRKQSTVLQYEESKHHPPPPPRRFGSSSSDVGSFGGTSAGGAAAGAQKGPPPAPARKPAGLGGRGGGASAAPPPLPTRRDSTPAPPYAPALPTRGAAPPPAPPPRNLPPPAIVSPAPEPSPPPRDAFSPVLSAAAGLAEQVQSQLKVYDEPEEVQEGGWKKFSEYGEEDKREFFAALDLFFASKTPLAEHAPAPPSPAPYLPPAPTAAAPPVALSTRPRLPPTSSSTPQPFAPTPKPPELHGPSYPPTESHSSAALSLLHYILHAPFSTPWFVHSTSPSFSPLPPPLVGRSDTRFTCSWQQSGAQKVALGAVLFGDTSVAWYRLSWSLSSEQAGRAHLDVRREGRYRPRHPPMDADALYAASEAYGPLICAWADEALAAGVPVARGECWDLANEALLHVKNAHQAEVPPPFPSIARTHGSFLYYASAEAGGERGEGGEVVGTWTGGDVYVRPGDVVEWRKVTIREVGAAPGGYSKLGDPDHTALILSASPPSSLPVPSSSDPLVCPSYPLSALVSLTVLEQSLGRAPSVATYDLGAMSKGEVWIYRPVPAREVLGGVDEVSASWPVGEVECWEVGELE